MIGWLSRWALLETETQDYSRYLLTSGGSLALCWPWSWRAWVRLPFGWRALPPASCRLAPLAFEPLLQNYNKKGEASSKPLWLSFLLAWASFSELRVSMKILLCPDGFSQHSPCCVFVDSRRVESHLFVPDKGMLLLLCFLFFKMWPVSRPVFFNSSLIGFISAGTWYWCLR